MSQLSWREKIKLWIARWMVKWGKLTHDAFTLQELNELLLPYFPYRHMLEVPFGHGRISLERAELNLNEAANRIEVQVFSDLTILAMGNPIYRAHLVVLITARPDYRPGSGKVKASQVQVADIYLVNDQYSLIVDGTTLLDKFMPIPVSPMLRGPVKSMLSLATAGISDEALSYLQLYLGGSKQRILDYHKPQLEALIARLAADNLFEYQLDESDFRELLFARLGKQVVIEQKELRFKF